MKQKEDQRFAVKKAFVASARGQQGCWWNFLFRASAGLCPTLTCQAANHTIHLTPDPTEMPLNVTPSSPLAEKENPDLFRKVLKSMRLLPKAKDVVCYGSTTCLLHVSFLSVPDILFS